MKAAFLIALTLACSACSATRDGPAMAEDARATLPANAVILPSTLARDMLDQCSRDTPQPGDGDWQPGAADIARFESALPEALARPAAVRPGLAVPHWSDVAARWRRQYVGYLRGGRRFIYLNALPGGDDEPQQLWRTRPMIVCDGGPSFFGAEYDVAAGQITHIAYNGSI